MSTPLEVHPKSRRPKPKGTRQVQKFFRDRNDVPSPLSPAFKGNFHSSPCVLHFWKLPGTASLLQGAECCFPLKPQSFCFSLHFFLTKDIFPLRSCESLSVLIPAATHYLTMRFISIKERQPRVFHLSWKIAAPLLDQASPSYDPLRLRHAIPPCQRTHPTPSSPLSLSVFLIFVSRIFFSSSSHLRRHAADLILRKTILPGYHFVRLMSAFPFVISTMPPSFVSTKPRFFTFPRGVPPCARGTALLVACLRSTRTIIGVLRDFLRLLPPGSTEFFPYASLLTLLLDFKDLRVLGVRSHPNPC